MIIVCYIMFDDVFIIIIEVLASNNMQNLKSKTRVSRKQIFSLFNHILDYFNELASPKYIFVALNGFLVPKIIYKHNKHALISWKIRNIHTNLEIRWPKHKFEVIHIKISFLGGTYSILVRFSK